MKLNCYKTKANMLLFLEFVNSRENRKCCGGRINIEAANAGLSKNIARIKAMYIAELLLASAEDSEA